MRINGKLQRVQEYDNKYFYGYLFADSLQELRAKVIKADKLADKYIGESND